MSSRAMIRLSIPTIEEDDLQAVRDALASGFLVQGSRVAAFEQVAADQVGAKHAMAVANGTCALSLALEALDVGPGDMCLVTTYSWVATANVIELRGARPVFVDVDAESFNIDPEKLQTHLKSLMADRTSSRRVKAVVPVHTFGQMTNMHRVMAICGHYGLHVVEDAACALGASFLGRQAGSWGKFGCFSFHPRKSVTTGEGGIVATDDDKLADRVRALRNHGLDHAAASMDFVLPGHNYRLTEFQAALGVTQLAKLPRILAARRAAAARYDALLEGGPLRSPRVLQDLAHVYQSYVALLPASPPHHRATLIRRAREVGVEVQVGTIHMPLTSYYRNKYGYKPGDFPITDDIAARTLSLPLHEKITAEQQRRVVEVVTGLLE